MRKRHAGWLICGVVLTSVSVQPVDTRAKLEIRTLSSRADLVSGGDTLLAVTVPPGTRADQLTVTINGRDVTAKLARDGESEEFRGLVDGLVAGSNKVVAKTRTPKADATLTIVNHPITGPMRSGERGGPKTRRPGTSATRSSA